MSFSGVQLSMLIGKGIPLPAPAALMVALRSAEVTIANTGPSAFQLKFQLARSTSGFDYELLPYLEPWTRVVLTVILAGSPTVIADGLVTHRDLTPARGKEPDTISITCENVSVVMDLIEKSTPFPGLDDFAIVNAILLEYAEYGIIPTVSPTSYSISDMPEDVTQQQTGTDLAYVRMLAERNGYVFYVRPGPVPLTNIGYFGPPVRTGSVFPALSIGPLPISAVESISFAYDALAPQVVEGQVQDTLETDADVPVAAFVSTRMPPLAARPAIVANLPFVRSTILCADGMDPVQAFAKAQGQADLASDNVLTAQGTLDVFRYQALLDVPGLVGVRGAGYDHDGYYVVTSVTHSITPTSYKQSFSLAREGLGSTVLGVVP